MFFIAMAEPATAAAALATSTLMRVEQMLSSALGELAEATGSEQPSVQAPAKQMYAWAQHQLMKKAARVDEAARAT